MDISVVPGGAAEPQWQVVQGGGKLPSDRGVGQGRAAGKPSQAPAGWLPDMVVVAVAVEGLVDVEQEGKVFRLLKMGFLASALKQLRGQQLQLVVM